MIETLKLMSDIRIEMSLIEFMFYSFLYFGLGTILIMSIIILSDLRFINYEKTKTRSSKKPDKKQKSTKCNESESQRDNDEIHIGGSDLH